MLNTTEIFQICVFAFAAVTSYPACLSIWRSGERSRKAIDDGKVHRYEDGDGLASEEAQEAYEATVHPKILLTLTAVASATSLATAVRATDAGTSFIEAWLAFGTWLWSLFQCIGLLMEHQERKRFALSGWLSLVGILLLLEETVLISYDIASMALAALRFLILALMVWLASRIPRRPVVESDIGIVDGQYTVPLYQRMTFSWISPMLQKARQSNIVSLNLPDLPILHQAGRAGYLHNHFKLTGPNAVLWRRIFRSHKREILGHYGMAVLHSVSQLASQWVMYQLLRALELRSQGAPLGRGIFFWVFALGASIVFAAWLETQILWIVNTKLVICLRSELTAMLYAKLLSKKNVVRLPETREHRVKSEGDDEEQHVKVDDSQPMIGEVSADLDQDVINLVALDTKLITDLMSASYLIPGAISKLVISMIFLLQLIGWQSVLAGFLALLLANPLNIYCSRLMNIAQIELMRIRDSKMSIINEVLHSIRQIKFTATEDEWYGRIKDQRDQELRTLWHTFMLRTALVAFWQIGPVLFSTVSLAVYSILSGSLLPSIAFTTIAIFGQIEGSLAILPKLILQVFQASVSFRRIQSFEEMPDQGSYFDTEGNDDGIVLQSASFRWPSDQSLLADSHAFSLTDLDVTFPKDKLSIVSGDTGSGKSLLLKALVGEAELLDGKISLPDPHPATINNDWTPSAESRGKMMAYVSQDVWIENATIKDNILFDLPWVEKRYQQTIFACGLSQDLAIWPDGDGTEVGVGGVNLSGGQKWRLSLAKALYSQASVLVIDDIFSALDAHVGRHVWEHALTGLLARERTMVLATHHVDLCLSDADFLVRLERGKIVGARDLPGRQAQNEAQTSHENEPSPPESMDGLSSSGNTPPNYSVNDPTTEETSHLTSSAQSLNMKKEPEKFIAEEARETGAVKFGTYLYYISAVGGISMSVFVLGAHLGYTLSGFGRTWWLSVWTRQSEHDSDAAPALFLSQSVGPVHLPPGISVKQNPASHKDLHFYLWIYLAFSVLVCFAGIIKFFSVLIGSVRASRQLFEKFTSSILHAPIDWLDRVPTGRILNRFTADFETIDNMMADGIGFFLTMCFQLFAIVIAGMAVSPYIILAAAFLLGMSILVARQYLPAARDVKRLDSVARSPILDRFQSTIAGLDTIRAYDKSYIYLSKMMKELDDYARTSFYRSLMNMWLMLRLNLIGAIFTTVVATVIVVRRDIDASLAGFALSFALQYTVAIEWAIRQFSATQLAMNSTERILEYSSMQLENISGRSVPAAWPTQGGIEVENLSIGYKAGEDILKDVSMHIEPGARIGIVGRTGAGKSTLSLAFFRFLEASSGSIEIDGVNVSQIQLHDLRSRLAIIPQDPVLFAGDVRANLDPFDNHTDAELCDAIESVHFSCNEKSREEPLAQLSQPISQGGANLSQGQKQLLCMARAVVARQKILIMDEATSSVDMTTDAEIQKSIRHSFQGCTLIVIAHRLSTLADFDHIFVLDGGKVIESGTPQALWSRGGAFWQLVQESGEKTALERRLKEASAM